MYISSGVNFQTVAGMIHSFATEFGSGFSNLTGAYAINLLNRQELSFARWVLKYEYLILEIFIVVGFFSYFINWMRKRRILFSVEFMSLSFGAFILFICILLPSVAAYTDVNRTFFLTMIFLAPFGIAGIFVLVAIGFWLSPILHFQRPSMFFAKISKLISEGIFENFASLSNMMQISALTFAAIFVCLLLLFGSGWISVLEKDNYPLSWALSRDSIQFPIYYETEIEGCTWLLENRSLGSKIYYDMNALPVFLYYSPFEDITSHLYSIGNVFAVSNGISLGDRPVVTQSTIQDNAYIYLRKINLDTKTIDALMMQNDQLESGQVTQWENVPVFEQNIEDANIIFDNGGSQVRLTR